MSDNAITPLSLRRARSAPEISPIVKTGLDAQLQNHASFCNIKLTKKTPSQQLIRRESIRHVASSPSQTNKHFSLELKEQKPSITSPNEPNSFACEKSPEALLIQQLKETKILSRIEAERERLQRSKNQPHWIKRKLKHTARLFKKEGIKKNGAKDQISVLRTAALNTQVVYAAKEASSHNLLQAFIAPESAPPDPLLTFLENAEAVMAPLESLLIIFSLGIAIKELEGQYKQGKSFKKAFETVKEKLNQFVASTRDTGEAYTLFLQESEEVFKTCKLYESSQKSILELLENPWDEQKKQEVDTLLRKNLEKAVDAFRGHKYLGEIETKNYKKRKVILFSAVGRAAAAAGESIVRATKLAPEALAPVSSIIGAAAAGLAVPLYLYRSHKDHKSIQKQSIVHDAIKQNYKNLEQMPDHELAAIIKLVEKKNRITQNKISLLSNILEAGGFACTSTLGIVALLAEVGLVASGVGLAVTPAGWAIGGALAAVTLGWVGYKIGKSIYRSYKKNQWRDVLQHKGKLFEKLIKTHSIQELDKIAYAKLIKKDKNLALNLLYEFLLMEHADSPNQPCISFLKQIGLHPQEIQAIIDSSEKQVALSLLGKRLHVT